MLGYRLTASVAWLCGEYETNWPAHNHNKATQFTNGVYTSWDGMRMATDIVTVFKHIDIMC